MTLREYLKRGLYSPGAVIREAGISPSMFSLAVRGKRRFSDEKKRRLADVLGISPDDIDALLRGDYEPSVAAK